MLNSTVLEVAAGVVFTFLAVSLATGAIVEALATITSWRSQTLLSGIKQLVNDPGFGGLAKTLYEHALINPRGSGADAPLRHKPAYIAPPQFANAMMDVLGVTEALNQAVATAPGKALAAELQTKINAALPPARNAQLNALMQGIIQRSAGDAAKIRQELSDWFDNAMDRVGGTYKRHAQAAGLVVALLLSVLCNIDTIHIARTLYAHPSPAQMATLSNGGNAASAMTILENNFPIGWPNGAFFTKMGDKIGTDQTLQPTPFGSSDYWQAIVGWLITALATLFGAPFWFDTLQAVVRLKGDGPSPAEKRDGQAASS